MDGALMTGPNENELVYDWNRADAAAAAVARTVEFNDETLRDGLQSPSVQDPDIDTKLRILHLMAGLGIHAVNLGLPGASRRQTDDVSRMCREIRDINLPLEPNCAARTLASDINPICDVSDQVGVPIEVGCFIGSSPIRQFAEDWSLDRMLKHTADAVSLAVGRGLPVMYVTEDVVRSHPDTIRALHTTAIENGAQRVCICDTVGHATPAGVRALVAHVRSVADATGEEVKVDWHGHRDRGLDVANTMAAIEAGVDRVHGTALGIGERSGNTPMDLILVNCALEGYIDQDLSTLPEYCRVVAEAMGWKIPVNYPVIGEDAFRTATGVHAAAVIKARAKGEDWLADRIYSGVPAGLVGRRQGIEVGPMSGASNVSYWLESHAIEPTDARVQAVFAAAKESARVLSESEIKTIVDSI